MRYPTIVTELYMKGVRTVARQKKSDDIQPMRPALTPEGREKQLIALAVDLAEEQLRNGTASSQVISHYLKLGTTREQLEQERLRTELELTKAKTEALESTKRIEELYTAAMAAFSDYSGHPVQEFEETEES